MDLNAIFGKFAGQALKSPDRQSCDMDRTLCDLESTAMTHDLELRVWWPGSKHSKDRDMNRVNVHVSKGADGRLRIENNFYLG